MELKVKLEFDNEGLQQEIEIFKEAFYKLDRYHPMVEVKDGKVIIKGEHKFWEIDISDYVLKVFDN